MAAAGVATASLALAVWAVVMLMRWQGRRETRHAAEHPFLTVRECQRWTR